MTKNVWAGRYHYLLITNLDTPFVAALREFERHCIVGSFDAETKTAGLNHSIMRAERAYERWVNEHN